MLANCSENKMRE
uniref:Uncharacterized protein n=1 Tax=Arundo donax TaxID=35708 RepID=A0A0A9FZA3_ARUDO